MNDTVKILRHRGQLNIIRLVFGADDIEDSSKDTEIHNSTYEVLIDKICNYVNANIRINKKDIPNSIPILEGHICFATGHAMYLLTEIDNGRSKYGCHKCSRCGHEEPFQFDYA
jgi:hypothetical protein